MSRLTPIIRLMSILAPMASPITRYIGFALVILGAAGASVGYVGWKDAANQQTVVTAPAPTPAIRIIPKKPAAKAPVAKKAPAKATSSSAASPAAPRPQTSTSATKPPAKASQTPRPKSAPLAAKPAAVPTTAVLSAPPRRLKLMQHTMAGSAVALVAGVVLVSISLYERPPKQPRSGADELLKEPIPF